ncbi:hypothetical protein AB0J90_14700 [Micromonospora sp. NPDC049523]|uniref:TolB family protein n=1 Tax=Micromonospora sp. NPDC049523 TaxID=3155921 RepID=UPI00343706D9
MNMDRLRSDLADLAEEVAPVDLRDRTLRTSRRIGIQRTLASSAAALVMLGAATGTVFAFFPRNDVGPAPATTTPPAVVETTTPPTPNPGVTADPNATADPSRTGDTPVQPTGLGAGYWYHVQVGGENGKTGGKLWHQAPGGKWQVGKTVAKDSADFVEVVSPDGRLVTWYDNKSTPIKLRVSNIDGSNARTLATFDTPTCKRPSWADGSSRIVFGAGQQTWKIETIGTDGSGRKVMEQQQGSCDEVVASDDGSTLAGATDGKITVITTGNAKKRTLTPKVPAGLVVHNVAGLSADGKRAVVGTHVPTPGECGCNWNIRNFLVDLGTGTSVELDRPLGLDAEREGTGWIERAVFLPSGAVVAQIDLARIGADAPAYSLGTFSAAGKLTGTTAVPAGSVYGQLVTYRP